MRCKPYTEEDIKEFMKWKKCSRQRAIRILKLIPNEILLLTEKEKQYGLELAKTLGLLNE